MGRFVDSIKPNPRYDWYLGQLRARLHNIEHFRLGPWTGERGDAWDHIAVAIDREGNCWSGYAECSERDQYSRKMGFQLALRRALEAMYRGAQVEFVARADNGAVLEGTALRDHCRGMLNLPPWRPHDDDEDAPDPTLEVGAVLGSSLGIDPARPGSAGSLDR